ncbi:hypothetical protein ACWEOW_11175 [Monashia sp. NPDC004114]
MSTMNPDEMTTALAHIERKWRRRYAAAAALITVLALALWVLL